MGSLYLYDEDFELANIPEERRNEVVQDFFLMKGAVSDEFYASSDLLYTKPFSFGTGLTRLFEMSWPEMCNTPSCTGITISTYRLLFHAMWNNPVIHEDYNYAELSEPKTYAKFREEGDAPTYISCLKSWREWHAQWYRAHQDQIPWEDGKSNEVLPFVEHAIDIMKEELINQKKFYVSQQEESHNPDLYATDIKDITYVLREGAANPSVITTAFHDLVMARKANKRAYSCEIGGKILEMNGYVHEAALSEAERKASLVAHRRIYSVIGKTGRKQYVSLDFGHGMFEFFNERGIHLGEKRYDGTYNADAEDSHNLKTIS